MGAFVVLKDVCLFHLGQSCFCTLRNVWQDRFCWPVEMDGACSGDFPWVWLPTVLSLNLNSLLVPRPHSTDWFNGCKTAFPNTSSEGWPNSRFPTSTASFLSAALCLSQRGKKWERINEKTERNKIDVTSFYSDLGTNACFLLIAHYRKGKWNTWHGWHHLRLSPC